MLPVPREALHYHEVQCLGKNFIQRTGFLYHMPFHFRPYSDTDSRTSSLGQIPNFSSQWNKYHASQFLKPVSGCMGGVQSVITGKRCQMDACPSEAAQRGAKGGRGTCREKGLPRPSQISPRSSAARQQRRSWAMTHTIFLHRYPLGFSCSVSSSSAVLFIFQSDHLHRITLPLQRPLNVFIMTVGSLIAFNNISYEQILLTDPTALPAM